MSFALRDLEDLEATLALRLREAEAVPKLQRKTRENAKEAIERAATPQALETINRLRLFQKLLLNLRTNLSLFEDGSLDLRPNQLKAVEALAAFLANDSGEEDKKRSGYFKQPTGAGKTVLFGVITRLLGVRTLVLVPRTNLVSQTAKELHEVVGFPQEDIDTLNAGAALQQSPVTIVTYQSHLSRMKNDPAYREWVAGCELVVCDEAHRSLGTVTAQSIDALDEEEEDDDIGIDAELTEQEEADQQAVLTDLLQGKTAALKLGFTATPKLASKSVADRFGTCIAAETHEDLANAGILVRYRLVSVDGDVTDLDLEGKFTEEKEREILRRNNTYATLVKEYAAALTAYREHSDETPYPMRGVAFCVNIAECDAFADVAAAAGLRARVVTGREAKGKQGQDVIEAAEQALINGEIDLIVTVAKLGEGWNFPPANAAIWARACMSEAVIIQGIGRIARAHFDEAIRMRKPFGYVFETRWELQANSKKKRKPLSIASALARNGEDPTTICHNADSTPLVYEKPLTLEDVRALITETYTPQQWAAMSTKDKKALTIGGRTYGMAIATLCGVQGDPVNKISIHLIIGRSVWGEEYDCLQAPPERMTVTREQAEADIRERFTPEQWAAMSKKSKKALAIAGRSYGRAIATLVGLHGHPVNNSSVHLAVGRSVWGEEHDCLQAKPEVERVAVTREQAEADIQARFTPEQWAAMNKKNKKALTIAGRPYGQAIATLFGLHGHPVNNSSIHLAVARAVWGEEHDCLQAKPEVEKVERVTVTREQAEADIRERFTPQTWGAMSTKDKKALTIAGRPYGQAIASLFGVQGDPRNTHSLHLVVGRAIWGEEWSEH